MDTKNRKRSITVGLFAFIGLLILVTGILVLGSQQSKFSKNILVKSHFEDVKGLKIGNNVWFSGVKVGIIKDIKFKGVRDVEVLMNIEEKSTPYIRKDVRAKLGSDGFIGNSIITLEGGSPDLPPIEDGDLIESATGTDMDNMLTTLQSNNENLVEITKNFVSISENIASGEGLVGALLTDPSLVQGLKEAIEGLNRTINGAQSAVTNLNNVSHKLNQDQGLIHDLTTDTLIFSNLRASTQQFEEVSVKANSLVENLQEVTSRLNDKNNAIGVLTNDEEVAKEIKVILHTLNQSAEKLDQNMEALQRTFLIRRHLDK